MTVSRTLLAALALGTFALAPASAQAQQSKEAAKADIKTWSQAVGTAFSPVYWEGSMQELDAAGNVISSDDKPDCIKDGEGSKLGTSLGEMFTMIVDMSDCTTISGGAGSLNLKLECLAPGGKRMVLASDGAYGGDQVSWTVSFKAEGEGAPESRLMRMTARKTQATCS
ncbi:MAG: hypothetical protein RL299_978 [Pseudomonadota bacterium]|jgi:hypothetical protein